MKDLILHRQVHQVEDYKMLDVLFMLINLDQINFPSKHITAESIACIYSASSTYDLYPPYLLAVAEQEGGKHDSRIKNTNGTYDLGYMQFNTAYIKSLQKYNISESDLMGKTCYPYYLAGWRIAGHIKNDKGSIAQRISNYHSRTPVYNEKYQKSLIVRMQKWEKWHIQNINNIKPIHSSPPNPYNHQKLYVKYNESDHVNVYYNDAEEMKNKSSLRLNFKYAISVR